MPHLEPPLPGETQPYDVAIIGAGFSGSMLAVHLAEQREPLRVALIERSDSFGPGLAYGAAAREHLLNVPVGKMSAFPDRPEHFLQWVQANHEIAAEYGVEVSATPLFLPRLLYGRYLRDLVAEAALRTRSLHLVNGEVTDLAPLPDGRFEVHFRGGGELQARQVVLAWGNFPPGSSFAEKPSGAARSGFIQNPWSVEARAALAQPGEVLIVGAGLTCLDLLATARRVDRREPLHVLSRHGLFPQPHHAAGAWPPFLTAGRLPSRIREFFRLVRNEVRRAAAEGVDWRAVVDSLRPFTQDLWRGMGERERRRFLRHVRPLWETLRHRAAPEMRAAKDELEAVGILVRHCGRLQRIEESATGLEVIFLPRGANIPQRLQVQTIINASGPEADPRRIDSPLLQSLLARGLINPDALGLGIEISEAGPRRGDPLHTVGSLRKGFLWESTAVPELRVQVAELARALQTADSSEGRGPSSGALGEVRHLWLFEI